MEDEKREAESPAPDETVVEKPAAEAEVLASDPVVFPPDVEPEPSIPPPDDTIVVTAGEPLVWEDEPAAPADTAPETVAPVARPKVNTKGRGGTAGIFAGVAIIAPVLIRELTVGSQPFLLLPVAVIVLGFALSGFRVAQGGRDGKLGRLGLIIAELGVLILAGMLLIIAYKGQAQNTKIQSGEWLLNVGVFLLIGGILIFGAATLVAGVISRGATLMMMVSLPMGVILDAIGAFPGRRFGWGTPTAFIFGQGMHYGLKIFGLSLIWLGYSILKDTKAVAPAASKAA